MGRSILLNVFSAVVLVIAVAVGYYLLILERWAFVKSLDKKDFDTGDFKVYHTEDIKTVRYVPGHLGEVLREWPIGEFKLFRVMDGHDLPEFDADLLNSTVTARKLDPQCTGKRLHPCSKGTAMLQHCMFDLNMTKADEETIDARHVVTGELSGYQVAFGNLNNRNIPLDLWEYLKLPFSIKTSQFEHSFITNLEEGAITAGLHANPLTHSMAVQFVGRKTWLFVPATTFVDLLRGTFAGSQLIKNSVPKGKQGEVYVYTSQPGDVIFFPESWGHSVYTYPGPNLMLNFRSLHITNFLRQPIIWLSALFETVVYRIAALKTMEKLDTNPYKRPEYMRILQMYVDMCEEGLTGFDQQMTNLLQEEAAKF